MPKRIRHHEKHPRSTEPKVCRECGVMKPAEDFPTHAVNRDGLNIRCKPCCAAITSAWNKAHPGPASEAKKLWRQNNADKMKEAQARASLKYRQPMAGE